MEKGDERTRGSGGWPVLRRGRRRGDTLCAMSIFTSPIIPARPASPTSPTSPTASIVRGRLARSRGFGRVVLGASAALCAGGLGGCLGGAELAVASGALSAAKTGGGIWDARELVVATTIPVATLQSSVRRAFYALELEMRWERFADGEWDFAANDHNGMLYRVALDRLTDKITKVRVQVGTFGDQAISRLVLAQVQREVLRTWDPETPQAPWAGEDFLGDPMLQQSAASERPGGARATF